MSWAKQPNSTQRTRDHGSYYSTVIINDSKSEFKTEYYLWISLTFISVCTKIWCRFLEAQPGLYTPNSSGLIWSVNGAVLSSNSVDIKTTRLYQHWYTKRHSKRGTVFMKWQTHTETGSSHKSPCEWNERVFAGCENILRHTPLQTLLLINLSALCFESNLVQLPKKHSVVSGAWLCFEGHGLLPSQSTARLRCKNTSSQRSTLASSYTPHTWRSGKGLRTSFTTPGLSLAIRGS